MAKQRHTRGIVTDFDYGIQQIILHSNIDGYVTTSWGKEIQDKVVLWETQFISGKGCGIVSAINIFKGTTCIAMYGGGTSDGTSTPESGGTHVLSMKECCKTLYIDG